MKKLFFVLFCVSLTATSHAQLEKLEQEIPKLLLTCQDENGIVKKTTAEVFVIDKDGGFRIGRRYLKMNDNGTFPDSIDEPGFSYLGKNCRITQADSNEAGVSGKIIANCTAGNGSEYTRQGTKEILVKDTTAGLVVKVIQTKDSHGKIMDYRTTFNKPKDCAFYTN